MASKDHDCVSIAQVDFALTLLRGELRGHIGLATDALDDWQDLVPEELAELKAQFDQRRRSAVTIEPSDAQELSQEEEGANG